MWAQGPECGQLALIQYDRRPVCDPSTWEGETEASQSKLAS